MFNIIFRLDTDPRLRISTERRQLNNGGFKYSTKVNRDKGQARNAVEQNGKESKMSLLRNKRNRRNMLV